MMPKRRLRPRTHLDRERLPEPTSVPNAHSSTPDIRPRTCRAERDYPERDIPVAARRDMPTVRRDIPAAANGILAS
jgi:hypothetical protein